MLSTRALCLCTFRKNIGSTGYRPGLACNLCIESQIWRERYVQHERVDTVFRYVCINQLCIGGWAADQPWVGWERCKGSVRRCSRLWVRRCIGG